MKLSFLRKSLLAAVGGVSLLLLQQPSNAWEKHCGWYRGFYYGECQHYSQPQPSSHYYHPDEFESYHEGTYIEPAPIYHTQQPLIRLRLCIAIIGCN